MTEDLALLRAIEAELPDDTPRLVYADWLQENGEPELAALVRSQVKVYRTPSADPNRTQFRKDEAAAWAAYQRKWRDVLTRHHVTRSHFHRGTMVGAVSMTGTDFAAAPPWRAGFPVRRVRISAPNGHAALIPNSPLLAQLRGLVLGPHSERELREASDYVGNLTYHPRSEFVEEIVVREFLTRGAHRPLRELFVGTLAASPGLLELLANTDLPTGGREVIVAVANPGWTGTGWYDGQGIFSTEGRSVGFAIQVRSRMARWYPRAGETA